MTQYSFFRSMDVVEMGIEHWEQIDVILSYIFIPIIPVSQNVANWRRKCNRRDIQSNKNTRKNVLLLSVLLITLPQAQKILGLFCFVFSLKIKITQIIDCSINFYFKRKNGHWAHKRQFVYRYWTNIFI